MLLGHEQYVLQVLVLGKWVLLLDLLYFGIPNGYGFAHEFNGNR